MRIGKGTGSHTETANCIILIFPKKASRTKDTRLKSVKTKILDNEHPAFSKEYGSNSALHDADDIERQASQKLEALRNKMVMAKSSASSKKGKLLEDAATNFVKYLDAYPGLIEIIKGADKQYGGVAYGTLATFMAVAVNKRRKETVIADTLRTLTDKFDHIKAIKTIHQTETMRQLICEAFVESIDFMRYATDYWSMKRMKRIIKAITDPPNLMMDEKVKRVHDALIRINKERDVLDSQRLSEVQEKTNKTVKLLSKLQQQGLDANIRESQALVDASFSDPQMELPRYVQTLDDAFDNARRFNEFRLDVLQQHEPYLRWFSEKNSALLLLYGSTSHGDGEFSWLSHCLDPFVQMLHSQNQCYGVYLCKKSHNDQVVLIASILRSWICQLIQYRRESHTSDPWIRQLRTEANKFSGQPNNVDLLIDLLKYILTGMSKVYLIIDRVDRVKGSTWQWLQRIVQLMKSSQSTIYLLLIAEASGNLDFGQKFGPAIFEKLAESLDDQFYRCECDSQDYGI